MNNTIVHNYKQTEVGIIPEDWEIGNMRTNSTLKARIGWQGLTTSEYLKIGNFYLVTGTDFFDGKIKWETCHFVEEIRYTQDRNIQLRDNDILVTKDGTIGKVAFIDKLTLPATLNSGIFVIRPKNNAYLPHFLYYILKSFYFDNFLNQLVAGSTIQHLYQKDFVTFNFVIPPLAEQIAISTALSDVDALISSLETLIAKKRNIKQGAMQQLLQPKEDWEVKTLGELFDITAGGDLTKYDFSSYQNKKYKYPIYSNSISEKGLYGYSSIYSNDGDSITITARGTLGNANYRNQKFTAIGRLLVLNPKVNLNGFFISEYINNKICFISESTGVPQLTSPQLSKTEILIPNYEEQTQIAQILSDMDSEIQALETKLEKYRNIKQGMMQNLLTGKIRLI